MVITGLNKLLDILRHRVWPRNVLYALLVVVCFAVFCQIRYSDGDDAIFEEATNSLPYLEYLKIRYMTWTGRLGAESLIYLVFGVGGIWSWRLLNAFAVVLLPLMIVELARESLPSEIKFDHLHEIRWIIIAMAGYLFMDVMTFGHAAVWVNGSIVYTWSALLATIALVPAAQWVFGHEKKLAGALPQKIAFALCALFASLSVEQIGATLFCLVMASLVAGFWKRKILNKFLLIQTVIVAAAFVTSFVAPGNGIRTASEITRWMPDAYVALSLGERVFLTIQWLLSSFANEGKLFFVAIWTLGVISLWFKVRKINCWIVVASLLSIVALLPFAGIPCLSSMGLEYIDPAVPTEVLPSWKAMTLANRIAFFWWGGALIFTVPFLWKASEKSIHMLLVFAAGVACECMMFFSPTIYASGERVYFVTSLLFLFIILQFLMKLELNFKSEKMSNVIAAVVIFWGAINGLSQVSVILSKLG